MESVNLGKRILYGFAGLLLAPAIIAFVILRITQNPPAWLMWLLLPISFISAWLSYKNTSSFERAFMFALGMGARLDAKNLGAAADSMNSLRACFKS